MTSGVDVPLAAALAASVRGRVRMLAVEVFVAGPIALVAVLWLAPESASTSAAVVAACAAVAVGAEVFHVHVPHGETTEDLAFLEASLVFAVLVLPAPEAALSQLIGWVAAAAVLRRSAVKTAFNIGAASAATAAFLLAYTLLAQGRPALSLPSVAGLLLGAVVFAVVNLGALVEIRTVVSGTSRRETWAQEWPLSLTMAVLGCAIGVTAVALAATSWVLAPLALAPALGLWMVYRAAADRARERDRAAGMFAFSLAVAAADDGDPRRGLEAAVEAVRRVGRAERARLILPPEPAQVLDLMRVHPAADIPARLLPAGWTAGRAWRLDLGDGDVGALLLGGTGSAAMAQINEEPVVALATALSGVLRSIHARGQIAEEAAKLHAVIQHVSDGIAVVDAGGVVRLWSPAMEAVTGLAARDVEGAPDVSQRAAVVLAADGTGSATRRVHLEADGIGTRDLLVTAVPVAEPAGVGQGSGVTVFTVHDETATMRAERLKADFVATVSHELRTPLTPISGFAQLLLLAGDAIGPPQRTAALRGITEAADQLTRIVDDLLLVSRVASGAASLHVETEPVSLRDLAQEALGAFPRLAGRVSLADDGAPLLVTCDRHRALQCLRALLSNAETYTPPDSPVEVVLAGRLPGGDAASVSVRDHGPGIPAEFTERVFERFVRLEDPLTMRTRGSGLGLFLARELATAMKGTLVLRSRPGDGCTLTLTLPGAPEHDDGSRDGSGGGSRLSRRREAIRP